MHAYTLSVSVYVCLCVSNRVQMSSHPIYLQCSRQVWGSAADALSALITEQAQERAQAWQTHWNAHTHTHMILLGQLNATGNTGRIWLKWRRRLGNCFKLITVELPLLTARFMKSLHHACAHTATRRHIDTMGHTLQVLWQDDWQKDRLLPHDFLSLSAHTNTQLPMFHC